MSAGDLSEADAAPPLTGSARRRPQRREALRHGGPDDPERAIRRGRSGALAAVRLKIHNARHEGPDRPVRLILNRAYESRSANAALALITLGPIGHVLPHEGISVVQPVTRPTLMRGRPDEDRLPPRDTILMVRRSSPW